MSSHAQPGGVGFVNQAQPFVDHPFPEDVNGFRPFATHRCTHLHLILPGHVCDVSRTRAPLRTCDPLYHLLRNRFRSKLVFRPQMSTQPRCAQQLAAHTGLAERQRLAIRVADREMEKPRRTVIALASRWARR